ncbi:MAG: hypothetical protein AB1374_11455, partial [Bacillota bacterium]
TKEGLSSKAQKVLLSAGHLSSMKVCPSKGKKSIECWVVNDSFGNDQGNTGGCFRLFRSCSHAHPALSAS